MPSHHTVAPGECIASIALHYGFHPDTIWDAAENASLRELRGTGYVLLPGDVVVVPDKRIHSVAARTGRRHRFRRRGVPEKFRLQLVAEDVPRADLSYTLTIDGVPSEGVTDAEGRLEAWIPPDARKGMLDLGGGEVYELELGHLVPVVDDAGLRERLTNLGFLSPAAADVDEAAVLRIAILEFQRAHALEETGEAGETTRAKLVEIHGA